MITCRKCGIDKPDSDFEVVNIARDWRRKQCKPCRKRHVQAWALKSKALIQHSRRVYHQQNREQIIARVNDWVKENPEKRKQNALAYYYRLQDMVMMAYGGYRCSWCGITEPLVLCIDHVNNDGNAHRKATKATGSRLYKWLIANRFPADFQVLCMNCNHAKHRNGGVIPESLKGRCND